MTASNHFVSRLGFAFVCATLGTGACGTSSEESKEVAELSDGCTLNSDCVDPLVCAFERCHAECTESRDCRGAQGERCVLNEDGDGVCQLPDEADCERDSNCEEGQYCADDGQCRNECADASDCLEGQECSSSGACADTEELDPEGNLPPPGGGEGGSGGAPSTEGGAGGAAGTPGSEGGSPSVLGETCSEADLGNDDRDNATPYEFGTSFAGCLQSSDDVDFYEFTTPDEPVQGGYVTFNVTDVGEDGGLYVYLFSSTDNGQITYWSGGKGTNVSSWFVAAPGQTYRVSIQRSGVIPPDYTFQADFVGLEDEHEPNDERDEAVEVEVGEVIEGYASNGYTSSMTPAADDGQDWYVVDLSAGSVTATFDTPEGRNAYLYLVDETGASITSAYSSNGVEVMLEKTGLDLGTYYFYVQRSSGTMYGTGTEVPPAITEPYTILIEQ